MGHRNTEFMGEGHMSDMESDQQGHNHLQHPEPCIIYGNIASFPHPSFHSMVHDNGLFYGNGRMPQFNPNDAPSAHYNLPYMPPPIQVNHGTHDQLMSLSSTHRIAGIPTENYTMAIPYMDSMIRASFKRKNAEGTTSDQSYQFHNADINLLVPPEYGGNAPTPTTPETSARNRLRGVGHEPVTGQLIQGNPWLDMHFGASNGDIGTFTWTHAPTIQYRHVPDVNGVSNRSPGGFLPQGHPSAHSMQGVRGFNLPISTITSSDTRINHFLDIVDAGSSFVAPVPPLSFRSYRPHRREIMLDSSARHHALPHMRVLPEDEVAILGIPGYHEAGDTIDQHRDMRLDIDHMSYEELLALGEQIGSVGTGLSEEFVQNHLKITTFSSSTCINLEEEACMDHQEQINFCVVCQTEYEDGEEIGSVDCGHEYHSECIKKWLHTKNTCPVCKSIALNRKARGL